MNKASLIQEMLRRQKKLIQEIEEKLTTIHTMVDLDEGDVIDPEDRSHQSESAELEFITAEHLLKAKVDLFVLEKINDSLCNKIEPGAFVRTNRGSFFIGFSTAPFEFENEKIITISVVSPIYESMQNLKTGNTFSYNDQEYTILEIN